MKPNLYCTATFVMIVGVILTLIFGIASNTKAAEPIPLEKVRSTTFIVTHYYDNAGRDTKQWVTDKEPSWSGSYLRFLDRKTGKIIILSGNVMVEEQ